MFEVRERLTLDQTGRTTTSAGFAVVSACVARTGVQEYHNIMDDNGVLRPSLTVWRPEEEVMREDSLQSFAHKAVTDNHPPVLVDASNWRQYARGVAGGEIARDGDLVRVTLGLMDAEVINAVDAGKRELSAGYTCDLEFVDGVTPSGEKYGAIQRNIRINHIAVVDKGRAGPKCRIVDNHSKPETTESENTMTLRTVLVDGLPVEVTPAGAQVIATLQARLTDAATALDTATTEHTTRVTALDKELGTKDAEIAKLMADAMTPAKLDKLVADRATVIAKAKTFGDVKVEGRTNGEIRRAAVATKLGDAAIANRSEDYVEAMFDSLSTSNDPVKKALQDSAQDNGNTVAGNRTNDADVGGAHAAYEASLNPKKEA